MSNNDSPFRPYASRRELASGIRQTVLNSLIALAAVVLAVVAHRSVGDERLVQMYVVGAVLYVISALGPAIRWSNTPAFDAAD